MHSLEKLWGGADLRVCFSHLLGPHPLCSEKYDGEGEAGGLVVCGCTCVCVSVCVCMKGERERVREKEVPGSRRPPA